MIRSFWKPPYHYTMLLLFLRMSLEIGRSFAPYSIRLLVFSFRFVREGSPKKVAVLLDFFPNYLPLPPPPDLDNLYHFILAPKTSIYQHSI